jgi:transposase
MQRSINGRIEVISKAAHTLKYLPPYSPDMNPIEPKWAQAKALRKQKHCSIKTLFREYAI